jgi:hypothetical protein
MVTKGVFAIAIFASLMASGVALEHADGCYIRNYNQAHLAKHPNQLVALHSDFDRLELCSK